MRAMSATMILAILTVLIASLISGCSHDSSSQYGNLPVGHPGPSSAFAHSIPTLTPAQRDAVLAKKFGRNKKNSKSSGP